MFGLGVSRPERAKPNVLPTGTYLGLATFSVFGMALEARGLSAPPWLPPAASLALLGAGCWAVGAALAARGGAGTALAVCGAVGLAAEAGGALTGIPFGRYEYTGAWWPTVPVGPGAWLSLPVGLAWAMVAGAAHCIVPASLGVWLRALTVGLSAAIVDLAIEPVMAGPAGYWRWLEPGPLPGGAPVSNFFGWWAVASACGLVLARACPRGGSPGVGWAVLAGFGAVLASIAGWG